MFALQLIKSNFIFLTKLISLETDLFLEQDLKSYYLTTAFYKNRNDLAISVIYRQSHVRIFECVLSWFYVFLKEMTRITKSISSSIWNEPVRMVTKPCYRMNKMKWSLNRTIHFLCIDFSINTTFSLQTWAT